MVTPVELQRSLRRAIRSVASHAGRVREGLRRGAIASGAQVSHDKIEVWLRAIDETLLDFDDLPGDLLKRSLVHRITEFLTLADDVLDRLEILGDAAIGPPPNELYLH